MQASTAQFAATIAGASMTVSYDVEILLPLADPYGPNYSLAVESIEIDRNLTTDLPDGTRLLEGYSAAQATITLSGYVSQTDASKTIAWLLNPAESTSPFYRHDILNSEVDVTAGLYLPGQSFPTVYRVFSGLIDDYSVDPQAGTVTLTCLDFHNSVIGPVTLPSLFNSGAYTVGAPAGDGKLYPQFHLDKILRASGFYSWPTQRASVCLAAGLRGSYWPEVGTAAYVQGYDGAGVLTSNTNSVDYIGGPPGPGLVNAQISYQPNPTPPDGDPLFIEFFAVKTTPQQTTSVWMSDTGPGWISTHGNLKVELSSTGFVCNIVNNDAVTSSTATWSGSIADGLHYFAARIHGTTVDLCVDNAVQTFTSQSTRANVPYPYVVVTSVFDPTKVAGPISGVQVTTEGAAAPFNGLFTGSVFLDAPLNSLTVTPDTSSDDKWSVIQAIAAAEGAVAGFDETGVFRYYNRQTIATRTSGRTITPTYSLKTLTQQVGNSFVRNHIQVPVNQQQVQPFGVVWAAPDVIILPAGGTYDQVVTTTDPVVGLATTTGLIPSGGLVSTSGYRAAKNPDATTAVTNLTMTVTQVASTQIRVTVVNPNGYTVYLMTPSGAGYPAGSVGMPALNIGGRFTLPTPLTTDSTTVTTSGGVIADWQWPPLVEGGAVTNPRGELLYAYPANAWIQDLPSAQAYADHLGEDLYLPRPLWRNTQIVADPRLQLTDRVTVVDPDTTQLDDDAYLFGINTKLSQGDWTMTLDMRAYSTPGGWLIGQAGRSEIGSTTYI